MLLRAFTNWEPKQRGPRGPSANDRPIAGVDYQQQPGKSIDLFPLTVQAFLQNAKPLEAPTPDA